MPGENGWIKKPIINCSLKGTIVSNYLSWIMWKSYLWTLKLTMIKIGSFSETPLIQETCSNGFKVNYDSRKKIINTFISLAISHLDLWMTGVWDLTLWSKDIPLSSGVNFTVILILTISGFSRLSNPNQSLQVFIFCLRAWQPTQTKTQTTESWPSTMTHCKFSTMINTCT